MFYDYVKSQIQSGKIKVNPPASGAGDKINIEAGGLSAIAVMFLSRHEKQQIAALSRNISMRRRVRHQMGK